MNSTNSSILLTIDVEDWFQVENFKHCIPYSSWPRCELRVEKNTHKILDLLDSQRSAVSGQRSISTNPTNPSDSLRRGRIDHCQFHQETDKTIKSNRSRKSCLTKNSPSATFFILGWIAKRLPHLVREIHTRGHEVASHGYYHNICNQQSPDGLRKDLADSKKLLEDIIGAPVYGYRAPSFAVNEDILKVIEGCGYLYDSSFNSFGLNKRYGQLNLSQYQKKGIAFQIQSAIRNSQPSNHYQLSAHHKDGGSLTSSNEYRRSSIEHQSSIFNLQSSIFFELPISNLRFVQYVLPWGGGGYFRLIPFSLFKLGVQSILKKENAYVFYMHPWEIDPEQPRVNEASAFYKFRHCVNLDKTYSKLLRLIQGFQHCLFLTCSQYIKEMKS